MRQALYRFHIGLHSLDGRNTPVSIEILADTALDILKDYFSGFTSTRATGVWEGKEEPAMIVEAYGDFTSDALERARECAGLIRIDLSQDAVGLAVLPVETFELI